MDIFDEVICMIESLGWNVEPVPISGLQASVDPLRNVFLYNPDTVSIFTLTEEYFHIKHHHSGRLIWTDNDERNPNEHEAWNSAINWLKKQWDIYVGTDNYYDFMISLGVPSTLEPNVKQEFGVIEYNFLKETHLN